ncbi:MAG: Crp/Fnr family transcriptional regulator [Thiotrichaceae bacterium]|nr:Crp/Fnr family transcriptional regulator [Thiotrichaceae bacterium]
MNNKPVHRDDKDKTDCSHCPIRENSLYKGVPEEELEWMQKYRQFQVVIPPKKTLYLEGSQVDYVYTLYKGWIVLHKSSQAGKRQVLRFSLPGDLIGFQGTRANIVQHTASSLSEVVLCAFPRAKLSEMFATYPNIALRLLSMETNDLNLCHQHQSFGNRKDAYESIAFLLLELFYRSKNQLIQSQNEPKNSILFPLTQEDIGDAVGLTNVYVNRVIRKFTEDGLIECHHRQLRIIDEKRLSKLADFNPDMVVPDFTY